MNLQIARVTFFRIRFLFIMGIVMLTAWANALHAEEWVPPTPDQDGFDWIQLDTGEWLKGRIVGMQEDTLLFDSETSKIGKIELDMDDVEVVRSPRKISVRFADNVFSSGSLLIQEGKVLVGDGTGEQIERGSLRAFAPEVTSTIEGWGGKLSLGSTYRSGNVDQTDINTRAEFGRRTTNSRLSIDYLGEYSSSNDVETINSHRVISFFDYFLDDRLFTRAPFLFYLSDPFQNIDSRYTIGSAIGYDTISRKDVEWTLALGPAFQRTEFVTATNGDPKEQDSLALVLSSEYSWDITTDLTFHLDYWGQYARREAGGSSLHGEARLEIDLTSELVLDLSLIWDRTGNPIADRNGIIPEKDDFRFITSVGYEF